MENTSSKQIKEKLQIKDSFKNLKFFQHPIGNGLMSRFIFKNGYGISVVRFKLPNYPTTWGNDYGSYTDNENQWEVAIIGKDGDFDYETGITEDTIGYLSEEEVSEVMRKIQEL